VAALPRSVCLAVDDAGAGFFASFRHILELRPTFVKLDRSLISGIDGDPAKQALVAGMRQFARSIGCRLIAGHPSHSPPPTPEHVIRCGGRS
jgi:EAL domain-containing protein (putative c-di-GMP-specific phosphodiesterase class I)